MDSVEKIVVKIKISESEAQLGIMYLGIGGTEFLLNNTNHILLENGRFHECIIADTSLTDSFKGLSDLINIMDIGGMINKDDLNLYPSYIRFEPLGENHYLSIDKVMVILSGSSKISSSFEENVMVYKALNIVNNIVLNNSNGLFLGLYNCSYIQHKDVENNNTKLLYDTEISTISEKYLDCHTPQESFFPKLR